MPGSLDWLSGILFIGGMAMAWRLLILVLQDSLDPIESLDVDGLHVIGIALAAAGGLAVFAAQLGMGASWRIGVSEDQGTDLVTTGWFSLVRNPIYAAMIVGWTGFALIVPTWLAFAAVVVIAIGLELQVRFVEEPYLLRTHGDEYRALRLAGRPLRAERRPPELVSSFRAAPSTCRVSPHAFIEGCGLPTELPLRLGGVRAALPEEVGELALGQQRWPADHARDARTQIGDRLGDRDRHHSAARDRGPATRFTVSAISRKSA